MMANDSWSPNSAFRKSAARSAWHVKLGRFLGRSSRWATEEADDLLKIAREVLAGPKVGASQKRKVRPGSPLPVLVTELTELVAQSDSRVLERDQRFWHLVRELYARRPWISKSRNLVETVGVEVTEASSSQKTAPETAASPSETYKGRQSE